MANKFILAQWSVRNRVTRSAFWTARLGRGHKSVQCAYGRSRSVIAPTPVMNINLRPPDCSRCIASNLLYSRLLRSTHSNGVYVSVFFEP